LNIYKLIKDCRISKGYTQKEVAKKLNVETNTYCQYENGKRKIDTETFFKILNILEINISFEEIIKSHSIEEKEPGDLIKEQIKGFPLFSEADLKDFLRTKDQELKIRIIESCQSVVFEIAKELQGNGNDLVLLMDEGNIGLLKAIEKFDIKENSSFINFARTHIRNSMKSAIENEKQIMKKYMQKIVRMYPIIKNDTF
jgi:DNA-directed RNA polymerase sigma subunit (sigma70/sigma32)